MLRACLFVVASVASGALIAACSSADPGGAESDALSGDKTKKDAGTDAGSADASADAGAGGDAGGTPEERTAAHLTSIEGNATELAAFLAQAPKGPTRCSRAGRP